MEMLIGVHPGLFIPSAEFPWGKKAQYRWLCVLKSHDNSGKHLAIFGAEYWYHSTPKIICFFPFFRKKSPSEI